MLYGWNSALLAKRSGEFKLDRFVETFEKCKPYFDKLQGESLQTIVLEDHEDPNFFRAICHFISPSIFFVDRIDPLEINLMESEPVDVRSLRF